MNIYNKYIKYKQKYLFEKENGSFIKKLQWRRAEKHFTNGVVDINNIKMAIINSPSSYGIQPYHIIVITDPIIKQKLDSACYNQPQIIESYCLFIFCAINDMYKRIDEYISQSGFVDKKESMIKYIDNLPSKIEWAKRQAYIALGFGMAAAMELNIASCPMEGFNPVEISKVLNLDDNLVPCVLLAVGIKNNVYTLEKRFRFNDDDIFTNI